MVFRQLSDRRTNGASVTEVEAGIRISEIRVVLEAQAGIRGNDVITGEKYNRWCDKR